MVSWYGDYEGLFEFDSKWGQVVHGVQPETKGSSVSYKLCKQWELAE